MNLYKESSARTHLLDAKRELITLLAKEKQARREVAARKERIDEYERYAKDALELDEESLAQEIAEKIATMEASLILQEKENVSFSARVSLLKDAVRRLERRIYDPDERLQYILDYLDAAADLEDGSDDRELKRKMRAAGIGKQTDSGRKILDRIRKRR
jgi:phage shock protein A|tara:strand:+ start:8967 stop:9443 length:477 start_codon:yes stop_codon:yes gene_type:complete